MLAQYLRFLALCGLFWSLRAQVEDIIDCANADVVTSIFNEPIELGFNGTIRQYDDVTVDALIDTSNNDFAAKYIDARLDTLSSGRANRSSLVIYTTQLFANYAQEQRETRITLKITLGCEGGRERSLIFFQPIVEKNYFAPKFSRDVYEIFLPTPIFAGLDLTYFVEISAQDFDLIKNRIVFYSLQARNHSIEVSTKNSTSLNGTRFYANITLFRPLINFKQNFSFPITARDEGSPPRSATATVMVRPDPGNQYPITPEFERSIYYGKLSENFTLLAPLILALTNESYTDEIVFSLIGSAAHLFRLRQQGKNLSLSLSRLLTTIDVEDESFLGLEVQAQHPKLSSNGRTAVVVFMPEQVPESELGDNNFRFLRNVYEGFVDETNKLEIASIVFEPAAYTSDVEFELRGTHSASFILLQSEHVLSLAFLPTWAKWPTNESLLTLEVAATRQRLAASTLILIRPSEEKGIAAAPREQAPYALIVKEIEEERVHTDIVSMRHGNCSYRIAAVYPSDKSYVRVNEVTEMLESVAIDREDEIFANMTKPQVRVELLLECEGSPSRVKRQAENFVYSDVLAADIPNAWDQTVLNLIIVDINDNPPVFVTPVDSPSYLGYPDPTICFELFPEYLIQVRAVDPDIGLNAELRYSMQANEYFDINPVTGVVFPKSPLQLDNSTKLSITATDRAGAGDGLSSTTIVEVKRLSAEHVTLLSFEAHESEPLESTLTGMAAKMGFQLGSIRSAILPDKKQGRAERTSLRQAWIYAFRAETPVPCDELQDKIISTDGLAPMGFMVESFEDVGLGSNHSQSLGITHAHGDSTLRLESIIYLTTIAVLSLSSLILMYLLLRNQTITCCQKNAEDANIAASHGTCSPCSPYPVGAMTTAEDCSFEDKPEVLVTHMANGVSVEFQIGDDEQNCEAATIKRQSVAVAPAANALLREKL